MVDHIDPAITVFEALVEAAELVVDIFKEMGLIKPKDQTPQQRLEKARKDLVAFETEQAKRTTVPTAAEVAKRTALEAAVSAAEGEAFTKVDVAKGERMKSLSADEFAQRYAELSTDGGSKADALLSARGLASKLSADPTDGLASNDFLRRNLMGENDAQQRLRHQFQGDVAFEKNRTDKDNGAQDLKGAADALKLAAQELQNAKQPSITGAPLVGNTQ